MSKLNMFVPLVKVDESKREVWGVAAEEAPDKMGEIMDYAKSKPRFQEWSEQIAKASGGKSLGNVREMHQPRAVGKLIDLQFDDANKKIFVGAKIVDDAAWKKVAEGIYTGFSVGGDYGDIWRDATLPALRRYEAIPFEVSTVDNPAMYGATFELIRMDGSSEMRKFAAPLNKSDDEQPDDAKPDEDENAEGDAKPQDKSDAPADEKENDTDDEKTDAQKSTLAQNLAKLAKCYPDLSIGYDAENWDVTRGLQVLAQVTALMQSEGWAGEPAHVALLSTILSQLQAFLSGELVEVQTQAAVNAETQAAVNETYAAQSQADDLSDDALAETETMEMAARIHDLAKAAPNGANARVILESKIHQAYTVTCDQLLQRGYIDRETRLKISGLMGELLTKFADALGPELEKVTLSPNDVDWIAAKLAASEMQKLASADLEKRGARHNAGDAAMLQTIHDHACALGANCMSADNETEKTMQSETLKKMIDDAENERAAQTNDTLQKLIGEALAPLAKMDELQKVLTATGDLQKRAEDLEKQVKALDEQVQLLKKQPEAQLPILRVAKRDATTETANAEAHAQAERAALEKALKHPDLSAPARAEIGRVLALEEMKKTYQQGPQKLG